MIKKVTLMLLLLLKFVIALEHIYTTYILLLLTFSHTALQLCYTSLTPNLRRKSTKFTNFCQIIHEGMVKYIHIMKIS